MSGHSKWSKIKRQKGANDTARGAVFTKIAKNITLAASQGGGDPSMNFTLRLAIERAKQANMPLVNVERAIKKGTGELKDGSTIESITYEGYGSGGVALLIDVQTDNTNRSVAEIRKVLENAGGKMASSGSVSWQFEERGLIVVGAARFKKSEKFGGEDIYEPIDKDSVEMELLEIDGVVDINEIDIEDEEGNVLKGFEVITAKVDTAKVRSEIEKKELKIENAELVKIPKERQQVSDDVRAKLSKLVETLEEHEDVQNVWVNAELD